MRLATWAVPVALLIAAAPARAQGLSEIETEDLRLLYRNPSQAYLAPYAGRCFENSMRFQRWLFGYVPSQRVAVLVSAGGGADVFEFGQRCLESVRSRRKLVHGEGRERG